MNELPTMSSMAYSSSAVDPAQWNRGGRDHMAQQNYDAILKQLGIGEVAHAVAGNLQKQPAPKETAPMTNAARIIKVFIADPNENLPLDKRVIHTGAEQLTDLTDQELFFEVPIAELLAKHNELRKTTPDKKQSEKFGRDVFLEPARIRDLKMVVVTVAQF